MNGDAPRFIRADGIEHTMPETTPFQPEAFGATEQTCRNPDALETLQNGRHHSAREERAWVQFMAARMAASWTDDTRIGRGNWNKVDVCATDADTALDEWRKRFGDKP